MAIVSTVKMSKALTTLPEAPAHSASERTREVARPRTQACSPPTGSSTRRCPFRSARGWRRAKNPSRAAVPRGVARSNPLGAGSIHYNVKRERRPSSASAPIISSRASCATRKPASAYHRTGWVVAPTTVMAAVLLRRSNSVDSAKNLSFDASLGAPHTTAHPHRWTLPRL